MMKLCLPDWTPACPWKPLWNECLVLIWLYMWLLLSLLKCLYPRVFSLFSSNSLPYPTRGTGDQQYGAELPSAVKPQHVWVLKASVHCFLGWWLDDVICKTKNPCVYFKNLSKPATSICHFLCLLEQRLPATWPCWLFQMGGHTFIMDWCFKEKTSYFLCIYFPLC